MNIFLWLKNYLYYCTLVLTKSDITDAFYPAVKYLAGKYYLVSFKTLHTRFEPWLRVTTIFDASTLQHNFLFLFFFLTGDTFTA